MRTSFIATSLLAVAATQVAAQYTNQSAPFNLVLLSSNDTLNGTTLFPCHEGAAIEGLCVGASITNTNTTFYTYNFNTSSYDTSFNASIGETGVLTWLLQGANFNLSSPFGLSYSPTSNIAMPLFTPGTSTTNVAFDENDLLNIQGYQNDTTVPITFGTEAYYRWYICETYWGYHYTTLAWVVGEAEPQNPTCVKVDVKRVFVEEKVQNYE
ncbi:hypothetical protein SS1G_09232 [Sclerotinia sclerotiorum 1980 UF-70]|uniref:DUF7907 domain-containing protein n=2 Tax=Sclerotinia sclerotiorum (strain ATCC 18683 / 1980 / Ss-1) TaxID=665079 RepID=A7EV74_SCLS1|nr:hypothetical protein SS1G_09232 [Sclerotinia sclerotiorum 1980 UF-70]APA15886.1 hypothetical protein sscle_15g106560 [Sclerotinia sclerotiorum 1980 UF-70]EDN93366.1 hypothetical protein SS1G_09232 [Sclerotinia sclerotiorum 1980 UF-70]